MSAVIQNEYTGNNSTTTYSFTFPYLKTSDIKASLDGVATTAFTLPNATTLQFNTAPGSGVKIKIFRETSVDDLTATFYAGSAIKSEDLNDNFTQNLYKTQEVGARAISALGGTMTGNLNLGTQADLVFEGATDDAHETTIKVVDPTADRTITFPNVTGTVVTTGDTGTVATGMIAADAVTNAKIADDSIDSEHYVDGSIDTQHIADNQITTNKIVTNAVTADKIAANAVVTAGITDANVTTAKIANSAVTTAKIAADAVNGTKIADNSIDSEHYVDGSIDNAHLANNSVTLAKMADDSVGSAELVDSSVVTAALADNSVTLAKMVDNSVGTSELVDAAVTTAKLASNAVTTAKITDANVTTAKLAADAVTNDKLADNSVSTENIQDGDISTAKIASSAVTTAKIASDAVTTVKIPNDAITTAKIADSELKTLAGMQSGTASKLADSTALTADIADLNQIDGLTKQTTITDSDASFPTSGAVVDYVAAQIAPLGGLEVIATEVAFPNTQPQAGVVISISDAGGVVFNGSGTSTTGRTVGGSTVTINNAPSSLNSETLVAGVGLMVSSTGSGQVYNYHKILGKEDDIKQLSDDINDFNARYRVGSSNPTSALDAGDLFFNTSTSKLLVYNATNTAWEEAQSIGNFFISTLSPAFNGSVQDFTITNAPTNAEQIILSINGVIQKPNAGTSTPSEGFALSGSTVKLAAAPATGSTYFAVVIGSTVNIGQPSNNTVSTAVLQNSSVVEGKIADDAVTSAKIADGTIVNANVNASAAIARTKLANVDVVDDTSPQLGGDLDSNNFDIHISDNKNLEFGDATSPDLYIKHSVGHNANFIVSYNGDMEHHMTSSKKIMKGFQNSGTPYVALYHDNNKKFETTSSGVSVSGNLVATGNMQVNDDNYMYLGNSGDLNLRFFNGTGAFIQSGANNMYIRSNLIELGDNSGHKYIKCIDAGAVELYHGVDSKKLETTSTGVTVSGTLLTNTGNFLDDLTFTTSGKGLRVSHTNESDTNDGIYAAGRFGSGLNIVGVRTNSSGNRQIRLWGDVFPSNDQAEELGTTSNRWLAVNTNKILFNGDTATANELDDYEEGTWTPRYTQGSAPNTLASATYTSSNTAGTYQKIGRLVTFQLRIQCSSHTINNGQHVRITGLPFNATNVGVGTQGGAQFSYAQAVCASNNGYIPQMHVGNNSNIINFYTCNGNAYQSGDGNNNFGHTLHIHGHYITNT